MQATLLRVIYRMMSFEIIKLLILFIHLILIDPCLLLGSFSKLFFLPFELGVLGLVIGQLLFLIGGISERPRFEVLLISLSK